MPTQCLHAAADIQPRSPTETCVSPSAGKHDFTPIPISILKSRLNCANRSRKYVIMAAPVRVSRLASASVQFAHDPALRHRARKPWKMEETRVPVNKLRVCLSRLLPTVKERHSSRFNKWSRDPSQSTSPTHHLGSSRAPDPERSSCYCMQHYARMHTIALLSCWQKSIRMAYANSHMWLVLCANFSAASAGQPTTLR